MNNLTPLTVDDGGHSFVDRLNVLYTKIISHFEENGGHVLNENPGSHRDSRRLLLWTYVYYFDAYMNWAMLKNKLEGRITESQYAITPVILYSALDPSKPIEKLTVSKIAVNMERSVEIQIQLVQMIFPGIGMDPSAGEKIRNEVAALTDKRILAPRNLKWNKRALFSGKKRSRGDDEEPSGENNEEASMPDIPDNTENVETSPKKVRVVGYEKNPTAKLDVEFFVNNLVPFENQEDITFLAKQHMGKYMNSTLQKNSKLMSVSTNGIRGGERRGDKMFKTLNHSKLFTGTDLPQLSKSVYVVKNIEGVHDNTKSKVLNPVPITTFLRKSDKDVVTLVNLRTSNIKVEYDRVISMLMNYQNRLEEGSITRSNNDLVTVSKLLENGGKERLVYLLINLFGLKVPGDGFNGGGGMVQVVSPSISIPLAASVLDTLSSMFLWF